MRVLETMRNLLLVITLSVLLSLVLPNSLGLEVKEMARGAPDFSNVRGGIATQRVDDLGEIAARMGSPVTHERGGKIVFIESFTYGLGAWTTNTYGTGADVSVVPTPFRTGPFSCKLTAGTDGDRCAKIHRRFPYPVLGKYGLEFSVDVDTYVEYLDFVLGRMDGTNEHQFYCRYDDSVNEIQVKDVNGDLQTAIEDIDLAFTYSGFQTIKLVVDLEADTFLRLIVNDETYDLSAYPAYILVNPDKPSIRPDIKVWGDENYNGVLYIDDIIVTQDENPNAA